MNLNSQSDSPQASKSTDQLVNQTSRSITRDSECDKPTTLAKIPSITVLNMTTLTNLCVEVLSGSLDREAQRNILLFALDRLNGSKYRICIAMAALGDALNHLVPRGDGYMTTHTTVLSVPIAHPRDLSRSWNWDDSFTVIFPSGHMRVAFCVEADPTIFKGHKFPWPSLDWFWDILTSIPGIAFGHDSEYGLYLE